MFKDKYLSPVFRQSKFTRECILDYEGKFEELTGFLKNQLMSDKISEETYEYLYNLVFDMIEIFYRIGGIEL